MKTIKEHIQFAIDNGFNDRDDMKEAIEVADINYIEFNGFLLEIAYREFEGDRHNFTSNLYETISSKPFIEAIARGILEKLTSNELYKLLNIPKYKWKSPGDKQFIYGEYLAGDTTYREKILIAFITCNQAIAIRDNKLEQFITNILK